MTSGSDRKTLVDVIHSFAEVKEQRAIQYRTRFRTFSWSYRELYQNAYRLKALLEQKNVTASEPILIWGPNSPAWVWTFLGALLQQAPVVPIDMGSHPDFVRKVLDETEASLLFTSRLNDSLSDLVREVELETLIFPDSSLRPDNRADTPDPDQTAEIIYTSGTTGTPKGTVLSHRNLIANQESLIKAVGDIKQMDQRFLSLLPLSHSFEQTVGFWYPLRTESTITYLETLKPTEIFNGMRDEQVNMAVTVPRYLSLFRDGIYRKAEEQGRADTLNSMLSWSESYLPMSIRRIMFRRIHRSLGGHLKYFVVGGAPLDPELEQFWLNLGVYVIQGYGLTETSPILTCNTPSRWKSGTVGQPLPDVEVTTADDGEILARGENVFNGYFKRPELNDEVLSNGWFHTGDIGTIDEDGFLTVKGRKKNVIVTSEGMNVYPEDIEDVLNAFDAVQDVCVLDLNDRITAVFLPEEESFDPDQTIREANKQLSEEQKIQDWKIWPEDDFPRTTTLKIRRMEVREKFEESPEEDAAEGETDEEEEEMGPVGMAGDDLTGILARVSDRSPQEIQDEDQLGPDLGLSSIDRLEMVTLIEQTKYVDLDEEALSSETTVAELKHLVESSSLSDSEDKFRRWTRSPLISACRILFQLLVMKPILWMFCRRIDVHGGNHLNGTRGPCVFISNHISHFDTPVILSSLPGRFSTNMAVATWEEFFELDTDRFLKRVEKWFLWNFTTILFNIFPVPQSKGFRKSMRYAGELIDHDWNILFFPEGERTIDGSMHPFRRGIGIIAQEMKVPIVPIRIDGLETILPRWASWPREGSVRVQIGEPIAKFSESSYSEISESLQERIQSMQPESERQEEKVSITFYEGEDCPLCHKAKQKIARYTLNHPVSMNTRNIEDDQELYQEYKNAIPVVYVGDELASKGKLNERRFERLLKEALSANSTQNP